MADQQERAGVGEVGIMLEGPWGPLGDVVGVVSGEHAAGRVDGVDRVEVPQREQVAVACVLQGVGVAPVVAEVVEALVVL